MKVLGLHSLMLMPFFLFVYKKTGWIIVVFTNWARFGFYPTKIPPFEPQFHAEFENEGPMASLFDFDVVFDYFYIKNLLEHRFFYKLGTV